MQFFRSCVVLSLLLLFLPGAFSLSAQAGLGRGEEPSRIFRSNSLGMPLEEISVYRQDEFEFILEREEGAGDSRTTLYRQGKEEVFWERSYGAGGVLETEKEVRGNEVTERFFQEGLLAEETITSPDGRIERVRYSYQDGRIVGIRRTNEDESIPETRIDYRVGPDGRLLGVYQREGEVEERRTEFFYQNDGGYGEWHQRDGQTEYYQFRGGRPLLQEQWQNRELTERIAWTEEDGRYLRVSEYPGEDRIVYDLLEDNGRLTGQEERTPEGTIYREFTYQDEVLTQLVERRPGEKIRYSYLHGPDGLMEERVERNDLLVSRILYLSGGRERHETYRRGVLLAVVEYLDGIPQEAGR